MVQAPMRWFEKYGVYVDAPTVARVHVVRMRTWAPVRRVWGTRQPWDTHRQREYQPYNGS